jgi:hypothetical protein
MVKCAPVKGNFVELWLNVDGIHAVVVWQGVQSRLKIAVT